MAEDDATRAAKQKAWEAQYGPKVGHSLGNAYFSDGFDAGVEHGCCRHEAWTELGEAHAELDILEAKLANLLTVSQQVLASSARFGTRKEDTHALVSVKAHKALAEAVKELE